MEHQRQHPILLLLLVLQWFAHPSFMNAEELGDSVVVDLEGNAGATPNIASPRQFSSADLQCRIWLAPSTIKGAGLGMFAGSDFELDEEVLPGGDVAIPITDLVSHNRARGQAEYGAFLWDDYTWSASGLRMDSEGYDSSVASEGFGSAANSFLPLVNVEEWSPKLIYNGLHRSRDPGAGASSSFHRRRSTAKRHIFAGEEFYVSCT